MAFGCVRVRVLMNVTFLVFCVRFRCFGLILLIEISGFLSGGCMAVWVYGFRDEMDVGLVLESLRSRRVCMGFKGLL